MTSSSRLRFVAAMMRTSTLLRLRRADAADLALLERAQQLRLQIDRQLAELVEEQRAAVGLLEQTRAASSSRR